jgi:hypothetical protein
MFRFPGALLTELGSKWVDLWLLVFTKNRTIVVFGRDAFQLIAVAKPFPAEQPKG